MLFPVRCCAQIRIAVVGLLGSIKLKVNFLTKTHIRHFRLIVTERRNAERLTEVAVKSSCTFLIRKVALTA
jgi:hypothetical protein